MRAICLALPNAVGNEGVASGVGALSGSGVISFGVSRRIFARVFVVTDPEGREVVVLWIRADPGEREFLLASGHPYFPAGTREVGIVLDARTDWTEISELVTESYLIVAPKKLAADVEAALPPSANDAS